MYLIIVMYIVMLAMMYMYIWLKCKPSHSLVELYNIWQFSPPSLFLSLAPLLSLGVYGQCKYVYYGKHSEGNRFIRNHHLWGRAHASGSVVRLILLLSLPPSLYTICKHLCAKNILVVYQLFNAAFLCYCKAIIMCCNIVYKENVIFKIC